MRFWKLNFFDGEATLDSEEQTQAQETSESQPAATSETDSGNNTGTSDSSSDSTEDFSIYDEKSPLLFSGTKPGESTEADTEQTEENAQPTDAQTKEQTTTPENEKQPYRVLKYHGQEVPVDTEEDFVRLASQGLDYTRKTQQIAPYRTIVERLNADPSLMAQVMALVQNGTVPQLQMQQQTPQAPAQPSEPEPEMRDDETWDEYKERLGKWKETQSEQQNVPQPDPQELFKQQFDQAMNDRMRQESAVRVAQLTLQDPAYEEVLSAISNLPPSLQQTMNNDPITYQIVYDQIRSNIANGQMYFAELRNNRQPQQQAQAAVQPAQAAQTQQPVQLKANSKPAPFVEGARGQRTPGAKRSGVQGLPDDIWGMDDKKFNALVEKSMTNIS